jgi:uncharacterized protein (DUF1778 family)
MTSTGDLKHVITIRLASDERDALDVAARRNARTVSSFVRHLIRQALAGGEVPDATQG